MHRAVLQACLPSLVALLVGFCLLWVVLKLSRARFAFARLRNVLRCERGSVQSLSFVLTFPIFLTILLFIIQVSQLMIGIMVVHYAAYAGARSACVWIPAEVSLLEPENVFNAQPQLDGDIVRLLDVQASGSQKFQKIQQAVVLACAPVSPSRDLRDSRPLPGWVSTAQQVSTSLMRQVAPVTQSNGRIPARVANKIRYAYANTRIAIEWLEARHSDKDVETGPTYNPRGNVDPDLPPERVNEGQMGWYIQEVGWQDPVTVRISHRFALLSSAGRFLAVHLVPADGRTQDNVSGRIQIDRQNYGETVYSIEIPASATMTNEGYKSLVPHAQR